MKYKVFGLGFIILILAAFFAPRLLFSVQDYYRMDRTWQGKRNSLDVQALSGSYDTLRNRMTKFAKDYARGEKFYVTGTDCEVTEEFYDIFEQIVEQPVLGLWDEVGLTTFLNELYTNGFYVEKWKRYVIYNDAALDDGTTSVAFHAWYMELITSDERVVKLLVDVESHVIYYLQLIDAREEYISEYEAKGLIYTRGELEHMAECYYYYYEAGYSEQYFYEQDLINTELIVKEKDIESNVSILDKSSLKEQYVSVTTQVKYALFTANFPYEENMLTWELYVGEAQNKENGRVFMMGIAEVGALISEFQE